MLRGQIRQQRLTGEFTQIADLDRAYDDFWDSGEGDEGLQASGVSDLRVEGLTPWRGTAPPIAQYRVGRTSVWHGVIAYRQLGRC